MMKHKHYDCIVAWAEGKEIEYFISNVWRSAGENPYWDKNMEFRIKPEPKPDVVEYAAIAGNDFYWTAYRPNMKPNLKLTFDGEGTLKDAEVIK